MEFKILNNFSFNKNETDEQEVEQQNTTSLSTISQQTEAFGFPATIEQAYTPFIERESRFTIDEKVYYLSPEELAADSNETSVGIFKSFTGVKLLKEMQKKFSLVSGVYNLVVITESSVYFYSSEGQDKEVHIKVKQTFAQDLGGVLYTERDEKYTIEYEFSDQSGSPLEKQIILDRNIGDNFPSVIGLSIPNRIRQPPTLKRVNFSIKNKQFGELPTTELFGRESDSQVFRGFTIESESSSYPVSREEIRIIDNA